MDALGLLCNLHAAGPPSRRVLSEAGLRSLEDLVECSPSRLAALLDLVPERAERLLREARSLLEREPRSLLEESDGFELPFESSEAIEAIEEPDEHEGSDDAPDAERTARERASGDHGTPGVTRFRKSFTLTRPGEDEGARRLTRAEAPAAATTGLYAGLLAGLDARWCERLAAAGVESLEDLGGDAGTELGRRLARELTALLDLQASARHMLRAQAPTVIRRAGEPARPAADAPRPEPPPGIAARPAPPHGTLVPHPGPDRERSLERYRTLPHPEHALD